MYWCRKCKKGWYYAVFLNLGGGSAPYCRRCMTMLLPCSESIAELLTDLQGQLDHCVQSLEEVVEERDRALSKAEAMRERGNTILDKADMYERERDLARAAWSLWEEAYIERQAMLEKVVEERDLACAEATRLSEEHTHVIEISMPVPPYCYFEPPLTTYIVRYQGGGSVKIEADMYDAWEDGGYTFFDREGQAIAEFAPGAVKSIIKVDSDE